MTEARRIRSQIDAKELNEVAAAAQEANAIIDLRAFSWSDLFSQLETTLPENVRLTNFQPQEDREGRLIVQPAGPGAARAGPRISSSMRSRKPAGSTTCWPLKSRPTRKA